jgi:enamine deaminase RidA (YjgF/YER057c/UK114 family)
MIAATASRTVDHAVDAAADGEHFPGGVAPPGYRYTDRIGDELFVAGQVPRDAAGELVGIGDASAQARQCLHNLFTLIERSGFNRGDVRQLTVYVVGEHQNLRDSWHVMSELFDSRIPPATLLGVARLGYEDQLVEIDARIVRG